MLGDDRPSLLLEPDAAARLITPASRPLPPRLPLISCIMASRGAPFPALQAVECFRRQSYPARELVIVTACADGLLADRIAALGDPSIRLIQAESPANVGALRNEGIAASGGDLLCVWDDDDLSHPDRLSIQYRSMRDAEARGCFLVRVLLWWPSRRRLAVSVPRIWENTMLVERDGCPLYPGDQPRGEDTVVAEALRRSHRLVLRDVPEAYCYIAHGQNLCNTDHFEMLFRGASRSFTGAPYAELVAGLSVDLPMADYAAGLRST
jgi:glycosyltransferase involved in cell wall biosynthesis